MKQIHNSLENFNIEKPMYEVNDNLDVVLSFNLIDPDLKQSIMHRVCKHRLTYFSVSQDNDQLDTHEKKSSNDNILQTFIFRKGLYNDNYNVSTFGMIEGDVGMEWKGIKLTHSYIFLWNDFEIAKINIQT